MLQSVSTTRTNHSNRFKRCESDQPRNARSRQAKLRPFFPVLGFAPDSPCPHGARIHDGDVCMVNHCASHRTQHDVDASPAPLPVNPEDRALKAIGEWQEILEAGDLDRTTEREIRDRITRLKAVVHAWSGQPTVYRPNPRLKGGR